jgi:polysaccharide export outer membrane protein
MYPIADPRSAAAPCGRLSWPGNNRNPPSVISKRSNGSRPTTSPRGFALVLTLLLLNAAIATPLLSQAAGGGGGGAGAGAAAPAAGATGVTGQTNGLNGNTPGQQGNTNNAQQQINANRDNNNRDDNERKAEVPAGSQDTRTEFQQMVESTTGRRLPIFGASLFSQVPSTFAPISDVPVDPGYLLGPGDEINVQLSGQVNDQIQLTVDRTGSISVPGVGSVHLAGLPYAQLNSFLTQQLSKLYRNFNVNAQLGSLRTIQVFVVGQARRPGTYSISSLSTLTNAVFASGGPLSQGSLRDFQVKRDGVTIDHFDLYDLLLRGDKTKDIRLQTGDVIFIPFVGPQVAVVGSVDVPAVYELKSADPAQPTTVNDALQLAGGETAVAAGSTVRLDRIFDHAMRSIEDVNLQTGTAALKNGDILSVTSVIDRFRDAVTLRGNVANPGRYVWHAGMRISDLLPSKDALTTRNYWRKRNQLGQLVQDYQTGDPDRSTQREGALEVHGNDSDKLSTTVTQDPSAAAAAASGTAGGSSVGAALTGNNSPFEAKTDVILSAPDIYWTYAVIERQSAADLTTSLIPFNLGKVVLDGDQSQNLELLPNDVVTIFSKADIRVPSSIQTRYVRLEGEFDAAGVYSVLPGETLRGLLHRVGGFTPEAYLYASEFTRESTRRVEQQRLREYADELEAQISATTSANVARAVSPGDQQAATASAADARTAVSRLRNLEPIGRIVLDLKPDSKGIEDVPDIALEDGDRFVVPRVPANVTVQGQVYNANAFVYTPGQMVLDYLQRAGGPDREADRRRMFVLRADGSVVSRQYANVAHAPIYPGDTIVVPPVIDKRALLQKITSIAQIVGNLALGAATIDILARD